MTVPPYAVAALAIGLAAWGSAKTNRRALFIIISAAVAILGKSYLRGVGDSDADDICHDVGYILLIATSTCTLPNFPRWM